LFSAERFLFFPSAASSGFNHFLQGNALV